MSKTEQYLALALLENTDGEPRFPTLRTPCPAHFIRDCPGCQSRGWVPNESPWVLLQALRDAGFGISFGALGDQKCVLEWTFHSRLLQGRGHDCEEQLLDAARVLVGIREAK